MTQMGGHCTALTLLTHLFEKVIYIILLGNNYYIGR